MHFSVSTLVSFFWYDGKMEEKRKSIQRGLTQNGVSTVEIYLMDLCVELLFEVAQGGLKRSLDDFYV